jgi:ATP synthase protein I
MNDRSERDRNAVESERAAEAIGRSAARKDKARKTGQRSVWFGFGMFGLVGWAVALPAILGVGLGVWLDMRFQSRLSWTLALLLAGVALGCLNAWYWISRESRHD